MRSFRYRFAIALCAPLIAAQAQSSWKFALGPTAPPGFIKVAPDALYSDERGYGFEPGQTPPIYFSVRVPQEGNYRVTVTLGNPSAEAITTVKAELRRLMVEQVRTAPGNFETRSFIVNVRRPQISTGGEVRLKPRETTSEARAWDDRLTLEFIGAQPAVSTIEVTQAGNTPTLYIAGDSTSTDQPLEPYNSWGQMLTRFFKPDIAVANHGESGESLRGFIGENRLAKLMSIIQPGDYLFIQMGHNDQKERGEGVGAFTTYKADLKRFIAEAALYEAVGPAKARILFAGSDTTHHSDYGSYELAKCIVEGIRAAKLPIAKYLVDMPAFNPAHPDAYATFDVPAEPQAPAQRPYGDTAALPTLYLIGDSTVRNGSGNGSNGQWGWGEPLVDFFDSTKINVVNRALGGRSSRTYFTGGQWEQVVATLKAGDFVVMQFGHNDGGPLDDTARARGVLPGVGEETREIDNPLTKQHEVVHTYGWYLRRFIEGARAQGATPIVCSLVPRKIWKDGKIVRNSDTYAGWAAQVAAAEKAPFLDLNETIARRYDELGPEKVDALFADEHTHTTRAGAELNAQCVVQCLKTLKDDPLAPYFKQ